MGIHLKVALAAAVALAAVRDARACSVCGCGDPLLASSDPAAITGQLRLQLETEYLRVDAQTDGSPGSTDQLTQWSYRLNAVYRPTDNLSVQATFPVVSKTIRRVSEEATATDSSLTGPGDLELGARYALLRSVNLRVGRVHELAVSAGASLPTGGHGARDSAGNLVDPHGQLGTGGFGPYAGLHYRFEEGIWLAFAAASYRWRTEGSYFDGSKYKFGDAALFSAHAQVRPLPSLALDLGVDGRYARADRATGADGAVTDPVDHTGGTVLSAAPGVYLNAVGSLWVFGRAQIPFFKHLFGTQDVLPSVAFGVQYQVL